MSPFQPDPLTCESASKVTLNRCFGFSPLLAVSRLFPVVHGTQTGHNLLVSGVLAVADLLTPLDIIWSPHWTRVGHTPGANPALRPRLAPNISRIGARRPPSSSRTVASWWRALSWNPPEVASSPRGPSFPTRHVPRLLDPLVHLPSLRLLRGLHLDVAGPFGGSKRRRRVEFRAAEEDHIHGDVVGDHLDDPPEFWQPVVRLLPLDGVLKPGDCLADQFVQPLDDGMQIRHHAPDPILDVGVAIRWHRRRSRRIWLAWFLHRTFSSVAHFQRSTRASEAESRVQSRGKRLMPRDRGACGLYPT